MTTVPRPSDPFAWPDAIGLAGAIIEPARTVCIPAPDDATCRAALTALANTAGGDLLVGVEADAESGAIAAVTGVSADWATTRLEELLEEIDPPVSGLVSTRSILVEGEAVIAVVKVRQSQQSPHIDRRTGIAFVHDGSRVRPVGSRTELDRLYRKGSAADARAERSIEGMVERMQLASYGHHGLAIITCLRQPSSEPYVWASEHTEALVHASQAFMKQWEFTASTARVYPAEIEFRGTREVTGVLRVTRAGCVAVGETLRRPQGDLLGTPGQIETRVRTLVDTACTVLERAENSEIVPRLLCEGLRSTKLMAGDAGEPSPASTIDTLSSSGPAGDAGDPHYRELLVRKSVAEILACYGLSDAATALNLE